MSAKDPTAQAATAPPGEHGTKARGDVPGERRCLRCATLFRSEGFGERICGRCKGQNAWRNAVSVSSGGGRRR